MKTLTKLFTATALTIGLLANTNNASAAKYGIYGDACKMESELVMIVYTRIYVLTLSGMDKEAAFSNVRASHAKAKTHRERKRLRNAVNLIDINYDQLKQMKHEQRKAFAFNQCIYVYSLSK